MSMSKDNILDLEDVTKHFRRGKVVVRAVDGVSLTVGRGETVGVAGESGCGKSTLARLALRLIDPTSGDIRFDGEDITRHPPRRLLPVRRRMQAIFQDPLSSLNPLMTIAEIMREPFETHDIEPEEGIDARIRELLSAVGLGTIDLARRPSEFSGGQLQRIAVARSLSLDPEIIVADEPTSALDPAIQAQIVNLLLRIQETRNIAYLIISHDLDVLGHVSDRLAIMYLGVIAEIGPGKSVMEDPLHPYTQALLSAAPTLKARRDRSWQRILLPGDPPNPAAVPTGCRFHPRCPLARDRCRSEAPALREVDASGRQVACHFAPEETREHWRQHAYASAGQDSGSGRLPAGAAT